MTKFNYFDQLKEGKFLLVESNRIEETLSFIKDNKIDSIYLGDFWGYNNDNIEPILNLKGIKRFQYQESLKEVSMKGLESFNELEYLRIDGEHKIDLSAFPNLKFLNFKWSSKYKNLDKCKYLEEINLWNFNTKEKDFNNFPYFPKLKKLRFFWGNATSLKGLEISNSVSELEIHNFFKLNDITKSKEYLSLKLLRFDTCKKIVNHSAVSVLTQLEKLFFSTAGSIESLDFLKSMTNLKWFGFYDTNILDGDLTILDQDKFEFLGFNNKRHYNRKYENLKPVK